MGVCTVGSPCMTHPMTPSTGDGACLRRAVAHGLTLRRGGNRGGAAQHSAPAPPHHTLARHAPWGIACARYAVGCERGNRGGAEKQVADLT